MEKTLNLAPRSATWNDLVERFAEFKAMDCLRASGPDRRRPAKARVLKQLHRQLDRERAHLPTLPCDFKPENLEALLTARGLSDRGEGRRPHHASFWNGLWRAIVLDRDDYKCCFCRRSATEGVDVPGEGRLAIRLELDHVRPRSVGGADYSLSNIRAICRTCNTARSRMSDAHFEAELVSIARAVFAAHCP